MSLSHSPRIVTNGLVFYYDMGNSQKSWKGAPTINLQLPNIIDWSNTAAVSLSTSEVSPINTPVYIVTDNNSSYLSCSRSITVPNNSNTYTMSIYIKKTYGATSARLGFNSGFSGGTTGVALNQRFNSDTGIGTAGSSDDLGSWWRWKFSLTNNSTGNTTLYCSFFPATGFYNSGDNATATGTALVSAVQIEQSSIATPFVNGTRSNTQAILDLTNNNIVTATSLTYASDGTFSFNGSNSLTVPYNPSLFTFNNEQTIIIWMKNEASVAARRNPYNQAYGGGGTITHENNTGFNYFYGTSGVDNVPYDTHGSSFSVILNETAQIAVTRNVSQIAWYKNGALGNTKANPYGGTVVTGTSPLLIGTGYTTGVIGGLYAVQIYNRALTAAEVQQNFNALKGRYGI